MQSNRPELGPFYQVDGSESPELRVDPEDRGKGVWDGEGERNTLLSKVDQDQTFEFEVVDRRV